LSQWSFPQDFILAVRFHHNPDAVHNANLLIDLVYLANLLSHKSRNSKGNERQSIWLSPAIIKRLNIEPDQLELISEKVVRWTDKLSKELIFP
jgi:HD-like signal output (HDOD) protein